MREADMQMFFGKYLRENPPEETEKYELKFTKTKSIRWDSVKEHQVEALLEPLQYHKLSDPPIFGGMKTKYNLPRPYDCYFMVNVPGFVVVWFYIPRSKKVFHLLTIQEYVHLMSEAPRKSFREEDIAQYSSKIYP